MVRSMAMTFLALLLLLAPALAYGEDDSDFSPEELRMMFDAAKRAEFDFEDLKGPLTEHFLAQAMPAEVAERCVAQYHKNMVARAERLAIGKPNHGDVITGPLVNTSDGCTTEPVDP